MLQVRAWGLVGKTIAFKLLYRARSLLGVRLIIVVRPAPFSEFMLGFDNLLLNVAIRRSIMIGRTHVTSPVFGCFLDGHAISTAKCNSPFVATYM